MSRIADSRKPNGIGVLPLQHRDFRSQGFSLDQRCSIIATRIVGRQDTGEGMGHWVLEKDSNGTLEGGNLWSVDKKKRPVPGWAFAWPAALVSGATNTSGADVPTGVPITNKITTKFLGQQALPLGAGGAPDLRYLPKEVKIPFNVGKAGADPRKAIAAQKPQDIYTLLLGISAQVHPFGGGFATFSFRGDPSLSALSGIQGVGTNSSFPKFVGVRVKFNKG